jgi:hypothetical protein
MKVSSLFTIFAIAASTITFSTSAFAISQPKNIATNLELQSLQISEHSTQKIAEVAKEAEDEEAEDKNGRSCHPSDYFCGWW